MNILQSNGATSQPAIDLLLGLFDDPTDADNPASDNALKTGEADAVKCKYCQSTHLIERETPDSLHYGEVRCEDCGKHLKWLPNPDRKPGRRPAAHRDLAKKYSRGFCELCRITEGDLPQRHTLESHHIIEFHEGGEEDRSNLWIVCTDCHRLIHIIRRLVVRCRAMEGSL